MPKRAIHFNPARLDTEKARDAPYPALTELEIAYIRRILKNRTQSLSPNRCHSIRLLRT